MIKLATYIIDQSFPKCVFPDFSVSVYTFKNISLLFKELFGQLNSWLFYEKQTWYRSLLLEPH